MRVVVLRYFPDVIAILEGNDILPIAEFKNIPKKYCLQNIPATQKLSRLAGLRLLRAAGAEAVCKVNKNIK